MLRTLVGEEPRKDEGVLLEAMNSMNETLQLLQRRIHKDGDPSHEDRKTDILTRGLISSLDELEQSTFAASYFRSKVKAGAGDQMSASDQPDYSRYVYFYKDGFIRVFSMLDKLGNLLNDLYDLNTTRVKAHYSYYTVLRQFKYLKVHGTLADRLFDLKDQYRAPMDRLRKRRNFEVHHMSPEMQDDLWQRHRALFGPIRLEDVDAHLEDLRQGLEMVCRSVIVVFEYTNDFLKRAQKNKLH